MSKNEEVSPLPALLALSPCTHCDGAGGFRRAVCCGNGTPLGDCCGNPAEELEQCGQCGGSGEMPSLSVSDEVSRIEDAIAAGEMSAPMVFTKMRQLIANAESLSTPRADAAVVPSVDWFATQLCEARNQWCLHHEDDWLNTDEPDPDEWIAVVVRNALLEYMKVSEDGE